MENAEFPRNVRKGNFPKPSTGKRNIPKLQKTLHRKEQSKKVAKTRQSRDYGSSAENDNSNYSLEAENEMWDEWENEKMRKIWKLSPQVVQTWSSPDYSLYGEEY
jgi:hypothetical protein